MPLVAAALTSDWGLLARPGSVSAAVLLPLRCLLDYVQPGSLHLQDFFQLLRPGLDILRPGKPAKGARGPGLQHFTADTFREQFGIEPHQVF